MNDAAAGADERLEAARRLLYAEGGLTDEALLGALLSGCPAAADWADAYLQQTVSRSWHLEDGRVKSGSFSIDRGAGLRTVSGESSALSYTGVLTPEALRQAAADLRHGAAARGGVLPPVHPARFRPCCGTADAVGAALARRSIEILKAADAAARSADPRIRNVQASLQLERDTVLLARLDGQISGDVRPMVYFSVSVIAEADGRREQGYAGGGGRFGLDFFSDARILGWVRAAADEALHNLGARPSPAGVMPVVLGPGWPGILLHEAVGHGLEGDFMRKGTSAFSGRIGQRVASPGVTVIDDGTLAGRRGSLSIDDEGTPAARTVLIEDGILTGAMHDLTSARLTGSAPTGNGRRESFAALPMPRMTNTFMLAGTADPADIIRSVKRGIYASNFGGGQVDITSGKFVFAMSRAWLIESGRLTAPVRGAMLSGSGPDALRRIPLVGSDLKLDEGTGQCGKDGQQVPVGVGMPTVRIDSLTVGGTAL